MKRDILLSMEDLRYVCKYYMWEYDFYVEHGGQHSCQYPGNPVKQGEQWLCDESCCPFIPRPETDEGSSS